MNDWQWFEDFEADARARGDAERARLRQIHREAVNFRETDPDRMLLLFAEGRRLALTLGEPWWVLLFDHWHVHGTLHFKRDYRDVLDPAVRNLLEVRKPKYAGFPQRLWIYTDLIRIYMELDPLGYAEEIEQTLAQAEAELPSGMSDSRYLLLYCRLAAALTQDRPEDALAVAQHMHAQAQGDPNRWTAEHYLIAIFLALCHLAHRRKQWDEIAGWAEAGEVLARKRAYQREVNVSLMWQAVAARRAGDGARAARLYRTASSRMGRLKTPLTADYYDAVCSYHELAGNLEKSLRLRDQQLREFAHRGMVHGEFAVRLARLRLLTQMGLLSEQDVTEARQATRKFRRPECYLRDIEETLSEGPPV